MKYNELTPDDPQFPSGLLDIPSPPKRLFCAVPADRDLKDLLSRPRLAIVGSRKVSGYGQQVTTRLAAQMAGQGITIISGLAAGVDSLAHQAALEAGGLTIAVLPSPLSDIVPAGNRRLAKAIVEGGGALITEYGDDYIPGKHNFVARNRLVAGLAQAVLITEAGEGSGSLHTARFASQQGKPVLAVPGNITSPTSAGANRLLRDGAALVTGGEDVMKLMGLHARRTKPAEVKSDDPDEQVLLDLMLQGLSQGEELIRQSGLDISRFNQLVTALELTGKIRPVGHNQWAIR